MLGGEEELAKFVEDLMNKERSEMMLALHKEANARKVAEEERNAAKEARKAAEEERNALRNRDENVTLRLDSTFSFVPTAGSSTKSSTTLEDGDKKKIRAQSRDGEFQLIPDDLLNFSPTLAAHLFEHIDMFESECDVASRVRDLCRVILRAMPDCHLKVKAEKGIDGHKSDVLIFTRDDRPVGFFEVKLGDHQDDLIAEEVQGQAWLNLTDLMVFRGQPAVLGVQTTFNDWRVCWIDSPRANQLAASTGTTNVDPSLEHTASCDSDNASIQTSEFLSCDSNLLIRTIASVFFKMHNTEDWPSENAGARLDRYRGCKYVSSYQVAAVTALSTTQIWVSAMKECQIFFLFQKFESGGGDGTVWRGCVSKEDGDQEKVTVAHTELKCAIKYFHPQKPTKATKRDAENHMKQVVVGEVNKFAAVNPLLKSMVMHKRLLHHALLMPLCTPLTKEQWKSPETPTAIQDLIDRLVRSKIAYRDVKKEHFAHFGNNPRIIMLDTCRVTLNADENALVQMQADFAAFLARIAEFSESR